MAKVVINYGAGVRYTPSRGGHHGEGRHLLLGWGGMHTLKRWTLLQRSSSIIRLGWVTSPHPLTVITLFLNCYMFKFNDAL